MIVEVWDKKTNSENDKVWYCVYTVHVDPILRII